MLISREKNFLYYHLYKVAGTSIRETLRPYCSSLQVIGQNINYVSSIAGIKVFKSPLLEFHPKLVDVKHYLGADFYKYYRFTFVRNPLDWQKSIYYFTKKNPRHHQHNHIKNMSFEEYLEWRIDSDLKLQSDLIYDDDELLVDDMFKFEELIDSYLVLKGKLGLSKPLKHRNVAGKGKDVLLSKEGLKMFYDAFEKDYEKLGYKIEE